MKQLNVFGEWVDLPEPPEPPPKLTIKQKFRSEYGYKNGKICGNCQYCEKCEYHSRNYYKCDKIGYSHSVATDIRKKDIACNLYEEVNK